MTPIERGESSMVTGLHCYICWQSRHYAAQCPQKDRGKDPVVNTITPEVQQVTTRSKAKKSDWKVQEEIRKVANELIEKANGANATRMQQEMQNITMDEPPIIATTHDGGRASWRGPFGKHWLTAKLR